MMSLMPRDAASSIIHELDAIILVSEPERDSEGRAKAKKRKTTKSASCPFYKQGSMEHFRDLALV